MAQIECVANYLLVGLSSNVSRVDAVDSINFRMLGFNSFHL